MNDYKKKRRSLNSSVYLWLACCVLFNLSLVSAATDIYRSVGPGNTSALDTGGADSNNLTIVSGIATFSISVPDNVGVGDAIQYDTSGDSTPDAIVFIHSRISDSQYTVRNASGAMPADASATIEWSIFRAYITLAHLRSATENTGIAAGLANFDNGNRNLVSNDENFFVACYNDAVDTSSTTWMSWTSDATHQIKIYTPCLSNEVGVSQRHQGKWTTSGYRIEVTNSRPLTLRDAYFKVEGLQLFSNNPGTADRIAVFFDTSSVACDFWLSDCIIKGSKNGSMGGYYGVSVYQNVSGNLYMWNNIIYDFNVTNSSAGGGININDGAYNTYIYNNTFYNCKVGIERIAGTAYVKNNVTQECTDGYFGSFDASSTNNVSDISGDAPGLNPLTGRAYFVEENDGGNLDFHLNSFDTLAKDGGVDLSSDPALPFSHDIDKQNRSGNWDCGADEIEDVPTATPTLTITQTLTKTPTPTITNTSSPTASMTMTATFTPTATQTLIASETSTPTITMTSTITATLTPTEIHNSLADIDLNWKHAMAYPNPATDEMRFLLHLKQAADIRIDLYNLNGERIARIRENMSAGNGQVLSWQCGQAASGIYIAKIVINGRVREVLKVVVK